MKNIYDYIFYHFYLAVKIIFGKKRSYQFESSSVSIFTLSEIFFIWYFLSYTNTKKLGIIVIIALISLFLLSLNYYYYNSNRNDGRIEQLKKKYTYLENSHKYLRVLITVIITIVIWGMALNRL